MARIIERTVSLDALAWRESLPGMAYQGEQNAHQFIVHCTQGGQPVALTGAVLLKFLRPDGVTVDVPGAIADGAATVTLSGNCYEVMGRAELTIFVTQDGATVAVYSANAAVIRTSGDQEIAGGDIIDLPALQARFEDMADAIEDCEAATAAAEAVSENTASVQRAFDRIGGAALGVNLVDHASIVVSKALLKDGTETTATVTCLTGYIPVVPGYTYTVNQSLGSSTYANGFFTADKTFISAEYSRGTAPLKLVAPENAAYLRVTGLKANKDALDVRCVLTAEGAKLYPMDETLATSGAVPDALSIFDRFDPATTTDGKAINYSTGALASVAAAFVSDYIPVTPGARVHISQHIGSSTFGNFFYSESLAVVGKYYANADNCDLVAPYNAAFLRVNGLVASKSAMHVYVGAPESVYGTRHNKVTLKPLDTAYGGYNYVAFSGGCMLGGVETYVSRFGKQHATPASRADWGRLGFIRRTPNGLFSDPVFPDLDYENLPGELRDPNLVSAKNGLAFLSGFATNNEGSSPAYYNYLYLLDADLNVIDSLTFSTEALFWGNTLITPGGYLLHCGYTPSNTLRLLRSSAPFDGESLSGLTFTTVHDFGNVANEATVAVWGDQLVILARNGTWAGNAILFTSANLEGSGAFTQHNLTAPIHAPALQPVNRKKDLLVGGSMVVSASTQQRVPGLAIIDETCGLVSTGIVEATAGTLNGYGSMLKISGDEYGVMYFHDGGSEKTELAFQQVNINYKLETTYYDV